MQPIYYKKGQSVRINNTKLSGEPFFEGIATLVEFVGKDNNPPYTESWKVNFHGDAKGELYTRYITP